MDDQPKIKGKGIKATVTPKPLAKARPPIIALYCPECGIAFKLQRRLPIDRHSCAQIAASRAQRSNKYE
eukprot:9480835-Pyramimonas_sp.AAC.1